MGVGALIGGSALSGIFGGFSASSQARSQKDALDYQAALASRNSRQARLNAEVRESRARRSAYRAMGRTRAAYGASGVQLNSGTPLDVLADQAMELEQSILLERFQGEQQARNFSAQSAGYSYQASQLNPRTMGVMSGISSAVGTFSGGGGLSLLTPGGGGYTGVSNPFENAFDTPIGNPFSTQSVGYA